MIKEIKYNGYTANPSDYACPDGDLATSIGVIPEDGSLKSILPPSEVFRLESGASVMYIHETANIKHYWTNKPTPRHCNPPLRSRRPTPATA